MFITCKKRISWQEFAMKIALASAERSEDPYVKVGSCILRKDHSVASVGYNGAPPGVEINWSDRDERRKRVIHAETNALRFLRPGEGYLIAVTLLPCADCLKNIASYGIKKVYYLNEYERSPDTKNIAKEFGICLFQIKINQEAQKDESA
jgi:dCMP deaminase